MTPHADAPHYQCVFCAAEDITSDVIDPGGHPDFRPPMAIWGTCRPNIRRAVLPALLRHFAMGPPARRRPAAGGVRPIAAPQRG